MAKISKSASIEDLREKNNQLEQEVVKLSGDVEKLSKDVQEVLKRQEESSKAVDDKLGNLSLMMEKALQQISGKNPIPTIGESSNGNRRNVEDLNRNQKKGVNFGGDEDEIDPEMNMTSEEYNWTNNYKKERDRVLKDDYRKSKNFQMPRMEFSKFEGGDPKIWRMNCEYYFEMFEVPESHKTRMAIMHFSDDVHEWYRCLTGVRTPIPWDMLVEEVTARFGDQNQKNPVDEFKRIHQIGNVEDFIKKFEKVKVRLKWERPNLDEEFFVDGFISGLKEEIKHTVELFNPRGLNNAFKCALKVEAAQDSHMRRPKEVNKGYNFQKKPAVIQKVEGDRRVNKENATQKPWQQRHNQSSYTYEQRKELGLCHKCHERYYPGHQCAGKALKMTAESEDEEDNQELEHEFNEQEEEAMEEVEQAILSMYTGCDKKKLSSMKFKGHVGKIPIFALMDSGSTHSFVNPELVKRLGLAVKHTNPMIVKVANGETMVTDAVCQPLKFDLQGHKFEKEVRLLAVQGYDLILGLNWLTSLGPMKIDWGEGLIEFRLGNKEVKLKVKEEVAEIKLLNEEVDLRKEIKKDSEVLIAQLFKIEEEKEAVGIPDDWQQLIDEFHDVFEEPKGLPQIRMLTIKYL